MNDDNPFTNIPLTIVQVQLGDERVWVKCEECTERMQDSLERYPVGFFGALRNSVDKYFSKEDYYKSEKIHFVPTIPTFDKGKQVVGMLRCSTDSPLPKTNMTLGHLELDERVLIMDYNFNFGHIHRLEVPNFAKYSLEDEEKEIELLEKYGTEDYLFRKEREE